MIPLTVRSHYSLMQGIPDITALCRQARFLGYTRMALTDTDNLYGMWPFIHACEELGIDPVIGAELTDPRNPGRVVCLVRNAAGYASLCRLITLRHRNPEFSLETSLPDHAGGLAVLTGDPHLLETFHDRAVNVAAALAGNPLHRRHPLYRAARHRQIPLVATPGSFFLTRKDHFIHQVLRAIDKNTVLSRLSPLDMAPAGAVLHSMEHYLKRFAVIPEAISNTESIAEQLEFRRPDFGIVMPPATGPADMPPAARLLENTLAGAVKRYGDPVPEAVRQRIHHELAIIEQKNFCSYFLVVQSIVQKSSRTCGRGSGAASIVAYCLGITNVCPIKCNLYFERFLNPGRTDPPDIDIDFAWDERDRILDHVLDKFKGHAAMVASHVLFQPRMAVREVARVFGLPDGDITAMSRKLPGFWTQENTGRQDMSLSRRQPAFNYADLPDPWPAVMACAGRITGMPRHLSVHPGGVVITPGPIDTYVPVETAPKGVPLMQWDKDSAEDAGLVKIDLLGNRSLGVIRDACESVKINTGQAKVFEIDPEDDPDTVQTIALGHTMGCFYIESPAMRLLQKKARTGDFEHVVIHSSIIRPAANEFINAYLKRLHTGVWEPIHPLLESVLKETFGIMVYQEDVSKVAVKLAGFSHAQADGLRRILSKKSKARALTDYYQKFCSGAAANGVSTADIQSVWKMISSFSGYSFCKPHSASYARVSFQAAFLKTHYPAEFMAAVISNQGGFYSTFAYVSEARRMGLFIAGPDVSRSKVAWTGKKSRLRAGLMAVKTLCRKTMHKIVNERRKRIFLDAIDFFSRVSPHENEARALIQSGSLDVFSPGGARPALLWQFSCWLKHRRQAMPGPSLFTPPACTLPPPPDFPPELTIDRLRKEYAILGFLCSCHPMVLFQKTIEKMNTVKIRDIHAHAGRTIRVAGWLLTGKSVTTRQGDPMKFLTFEDETGLLETVFFPRAFERYRYLLHPGKPYLLTGEVTSHWGAVTLTACQAAALGIPEK